MLCAIKGHQMQQQYALKDLRELVSLYMNQNELDLRKGLIRVDPLLAQLLSPGQYNSAGECAKDIVIKAVQNHVRDSYTVTQLDEEQLIVQRAKTYKGSVPKVLVKAIRVANKKATCINGLELFQIDYDELVPLLSHKCAGSGTLHDSITGGGKKQEVQVQGQHIDLITDILTKRYKIASKYIESVNMIESKKKKK